VGVQMTHVLITAGATRNPIDAMRYISAYSSGRTGAWLAEQLSELGGSVQLLGSSEALLRTTLAQVVPFTTTRDLMAKMEQWVRQHPTGCVIHSAAVGDYENQDKQAEKIASGQRELLLRLQPTPKIANSVRGWGLRGPFITFKAAAPDTSRAALIDLALRQKEKTGCDLVFANVIGRLGSDVALVGEQQLFFSERKAALSALVQEVCALTQLTEK